MRTMIPFALVSILILSAFQLGMGRHGQYDEEARAAEKMEKAQNRGFSNPARGMAQGVKNMTYDSTKGLIAETAGTTKEQAPVAGTLEGVRKGSGRALDNTVKGAIKVVTLGQADGENYQVVEPEDNSGEPTRIRIGF